LDACKQRRLDDLLNLYDATATVECCEGGSFRGRSEMERYWRPRLARSARGAFEIDVLMPDEDGVTLDYRGYDGIPVRTHFRFTSTGKSASPPARLSERLPKVVGNPNCSCSVRYRPRGPPTSQGRRTVKIAEPIPCPRFAFQCRICSVGRCKK